MDKLLHKILSQGTEIWYIDNKNFAGSLIQFRDGNNKIWKCDGTLHREGAPAVTYPDGREEWYYNGELHNDQGPAIIQNKIAIVWALHGDYLFFREWIKKTNGPQEKLVELKLIYG